MKDLILLTACKDAEYAMRGLLTRHRALGIRNIHADYRTHPQKDPGCLNTPELILRSQVNLYRHALVIFDHEGSGAGGQNGGEILERQVEEKLAAAGWSERVRAVVIEPELEQWVWSDSPQVDAVLGWSGRSPALRSWLREKGYLGAGQSKAHPPKEAMESALREVNRPWSSKLFQSLGAKVSVDRCREPSFLRLKGIMQSWFPVERSHRKP